MFWQQHYMIIAPELDKIIAMNAAVRFFQGM